ncbi:MAG: HEAT repeat domain-containing protein [Tepidisphaerales bacterium]
MTLRREAWRTLAVLLVGLVVVSAVSSGCKARRTLAQDARGLEDPDFPDERRAAIASLQRRPEGRVEPYTERFRQLARVDPHPSVRAQAVRALNQARDEKARPVFVAAAGDASARVQLEAVKALRHLPDDRALPRLIELATNEENDSDVRMWAVRALSRYPRLDVARVLVNLLQGRDFAVSYEARGSLRRMTGGKDFHYEQRLWLAYLTTASNPFANARPPQ